ncbi:MAG: DUF401 family protein [Candidatus Asgardarchaeia archaeon]
MDLLFTMFAFLASILIILVISKKSITVGILVASIFLGLLTVSLDSLLNQVLLVFTDIEYLMLATAVALIPIIGGLLNSTGLLDRMMSNFKFSRKSLVIFSPAILGLLPMPGGALFSAPMVEKATTALSNVRKSSVNVWYRHILHLIYPLATALIIGAELAGISIYTAVVYLFPVFVIALLVGLFLLLGKMKDLTKNGSAKLSEFMKPLLIILLAPILDWSLKTFFGLHYLATLIGVSASLLLLIVISRVDYTTLTTSVKKAKPWDFFLLILAIFLYQRVFINSGVPALLKQVSFSPYLLLIVFGFLLGLLTGRVSTPLVILIPIYLVKFGIMDPITFAIGYYSIMMGYIISPVHPCLVFTAQYFNVDVKAVIKDLLPSSIVSLVVGVLTLYAFSLVLF